MDRNLKVEKWYSPQLGEHSWELLDLGALESGALEAEVLQIGKGFEVDQGEGAAESVGAIQVAEDLHEEAAVLSLLRAVDQSDHVGTLLLHQLPHLQLLIPGQKLEQLEVKDLQVLVQHVLDEGDGRLPFIFVPFLLCQHEFHQC